MDLMRNPSNRMLEKIKGTQLLISCSLVYRRVLFYLATCGEGEPASIDQLLRHGIKWVVVYVLWLGIPTEFKIRNQPLFILYILRYSDLLNTSIIHDATLGLHPSAPSFVVYYITTAVVDLVDDILFIKLPI